MYHLHEIYIDGLMQSSVTAAFIVHARDAVLAYFDGKVVTSLPSPMDESGVAEVAAAREDKAQPGNRTSRR